MQTKQERLIKILEQALFFAKMGKSENGENVADFHRYWWEAAENNVALAAIICFGGKISDSEAPKNDCKRI